MEHGTRMLDDFMIPNTIVLRLDTAANVEVNGQQQIGEGT